MTIYDFLDRDGFYVFLAIAVLILLAGSAFRGER